jgi:hypothetical protein
VIEGTASGVIHFLLVAVPVIEVFLARWVT